MADSGAERRRDARRLRQLDARGERGGSQMLRNGHVNVFGRMPGDNDPNSTAYLDD